MHRVHAGFAVLIGCAFLAMGIATAEQQSPKQDKDTLKVPGGLAYSEFRGFEDWQLVSISQNGPLVDAVLANPEMIAAFRDGAPGNGTPFPEGSKMAKVHWL